MNDSIYAAQRLAYQNADRLNRENEILRSQAEHHAAAGQSAPLRGFDAILARVTKFTRRAPRRAAVAATTVAAVVVRY